MKTKFKIEFKKQIRLAIAAAVGFVIAFAWRDYIILLAGDTIEKFYYFSPILSVLFSAILITLFGVLVIWISSKALQ